MAKGEQALFGRVRLFAWQLVTFIRFNVVDVLIRQRLLGVDIPLTPHFDSPETAEWFKSALQKSTRYLEYGAGGSTYLAAQIGTPFISIDSDRLFLNTVKRAIERSGLLDESKQTFHYADIGLTGSWGQPVTFWKSSAKRLKLFSQYSDPPGLCLSKSFVPDLILIDGRFRVACALKVIKLLLDTKGWTLLVDDYTDRIEYRTIETYAKLELCVGRMAVFSRDVNVDRHELDRDIKHYETISD